MLDQKPKDVSEKDWESYLSHRDFKTTKSREIDAVPYGPPRKITSLIEELQDKLEEGFSVIEQDIFDDAITTRIFAGEFESYTAFKERADRNKMTMMAYKRKQYIELKKIFEPEMLQETRPVSL